MAPEVTALVGRGTFIDAVVARGNNGTGGDSLGRKGHFIDAAVARGNNGTGGDSLGRKGHFIDAAVARSAGPDSLGKASNFQALTVVAYPNPTTGKVTILTQNVSEATVSIMDLSGRLVQSPMKATETALFLDMSELPSGTYVVQVRSAGQAVTTRVVKY
ncbi:MAG: T9SS type A sorting domain-containing protein [Bacteroidia bacterium]